MGYITKVSCTDTTELYDIGASAFCTCSDSSGINNKYAPYSGFVMTNGATVNVLFTNAVTDSFSLLVGDGVAGIVYNNDYSSYLSYVPSNSIVQLTCDANYNWRSYNLYTATTEQINQRQLPTVITTQNYDFAVKQTLMSHRDTWSTAEQAVMRSNLGISTSQTTFTLNSGNWTYITSMNLYRQYKSYRIPDNGAFITPIGLDSIKSTILDKIYVIRYSNNYIYWYATTKPTSTLQFELTYLNI